MPESELAAAQAELEETPGWQQLPAQLDDAVAKLRKATEQMPVEETLPGQLRTTAIQDLVEDLIDRPPGSRPPTPKPTGNRAPPRLQGANTKRLYGGSCWPTGSFRTGICVRA